MILDCFTLDRLSNSAGKSKAMANKGVILATGEYAGTEVKAVSSTSLSSAVIKEAVDKALEQAKNLILAEG